MNRIGARILATGVRIGKETMSDWTEGLEVSATRDLRIFGTSRPLPVGTRGAVIEVADDPSYGPMVTVRWECDRLPVEYRGAGLSLLDR